jgi:hypothetical protein
VSGNPGKACPFNGEWSESQIKRALKTGKTEGLDSYYKEFFAGLLRDPRKDGRDSVFVMVSATLQSSSFQRITLVHRNPLVANPGL